jgi:hypothetical protein
MKKKLHIYVPLCVLALLVITNPSVKDFKDYLGKSYYSNLHKTANFFIADTYKYGDKTYFGFLGNIWEIPESKPEPRKYDFSSFDKAVADTTRVNKSK